MTREHDFELSDVVRVQAMLAFDQSLLTGGARLETGDENLSLEAIYNCQRLLEEVWPRSVPAPALAQRRFGRYVIERELGRGAFGVVFLASDSALGRKVALKVPRPFALVTPGVRRRFVREAEAASRLDHPQIVPVYDVGEEGPICFIASAYCEGPNLADWLRERSAPVPVRDAARLAAILSGAVGHAHGRGILHRDLKPSNILLQPIDSERLGSTDACAELGFVPRICDFGLAKLLDQESQETCSGVPIGSPSYMAPEQASGRLRDHGPATDVYALGAILYELLTGRPPLEGETDLETLRLVSDEAPPSPRRLREELPRDLETICLKCLEKQPKDRYEDATSLADDLEQLLAGGAVQARPAPAWRPALAWASRQPLRAALVTASVIVVIFTIAAMVWTGLLMDTHRQKLSQAVARTERDVQQSERLAVGARIQHAVAEERERFSERFSERYLPAIQLKTIHDFLAAGEPLQAAKLMSEIGPSMGGLARYGFAWRYLLGLLEPEVTLLRKPDESASPTLIMAITRDSRTLAAGTGDGRVELWDLNQMRLSRSLAHSPATPGGEVYALGFSPGDRLIAGGNAKSVVKIWEVATGRLVATVPEPPKEVASQLGVLATVRFTEGTDFLVCVYSCPRPKTRCVLFWKLNEPGREPTFAASMNQDDLPRYGKHAPFQKSSLNGDRATSSPWVSYAEEHLMLLDDGTSLAIKDDGSGVTIHNGEVRIGRIYGPLAVPALTHHDFLTWTKPDIAWLSERARGLIGEVVRTNRRVLGPYTVPDFSPDGRTLAFFQPQMGTILKDVATDQIVGVDVRRPSWRVVDQIHSPDGRYLIMGGFHPQIHVWHLKPREIAAHGIEVRSLAFSPDGSTLASGANDQSIKLWDMTSARERIRMTGHESQVTAVAYSPDGKRIASGSSDSTVRVWSSSSGTQMATLRGHVGSVRALVFSPDGAALASSSEDRVIRTWHVDSDHPQRSPLEGHAGSVTSLAFGGDGKTLYSGSTDKSIRRWEIGATDAPAVWGVEEQVNALSLSPDGEYLAAAHRDGVISLWDVRDAKAHARWRAHEGDVLSVAFSPDSLTLASTGKDKVIRVWDPVTTRPLLALKGHEAAVSAAAFSRDGSMLATGDQTGKIKFWRALPERASSTRVDSIWTGGQPLGVR